MPEYDYERAELRHTALDFAVELNKGLTLTADEVVGEARIFETYLAGETDAEDDAEA